MTGTGKNTALMRREPVNLIKDPPGEALLRFSLPFMFSIFLQTLYSTTDMVIVGQYLGSVGLSAVSNGSQLMQLLYMICVSFASAGQVLIAQAQGLESEEKTRRIIGTLFWLELCLSLVIGAACVLFSVPFLSALETPQEAFSQAKAYTVICGAGMLFTGLYNLFSAVLRGMGDSRHPLLFVAIASALNIVLDIVFIAVFHWGVAGAAYATVIGQAVSVVFSIAFFRKHESVLHFHFSFRNLKLDRNYAALLMKLGIPMALQSGAINFSFLFVSRMVNLLGTAASAAFGVTQKLRNIPSILTQGFSLGASGMLGQNWGAQKIDRVDSTVKWSILYCGIISAVFGLVFGLFPELCFRGFTQDPPVLAYSGLCMTALILELPCRLVMPGCGALINAQGFVELGFIVAITDAFAGRILLCWLLGNVFHMGALGYFLGFSLGTYVTAIPEFVYYASGLWKRRKVLV